MIKWINNGGIQFVLEYGDISNLGEVFVEDDSWSALDYIDCNNKSNHNSQEEAQLALLNFAFLHMEQAIKEMVELIIPLNEQIIADAANREIE